jgi:hypothetical protein
MRTTAGVNDQKVVAGIRHQLGNNWRSGHEPAADQALALEKGVFEGVVQCHDG